MQADAARHAETMTWGKTDIINCLADLHGYRSYLEIATATTGNEFGKIDQSRFRTCHRLLYRCPDSFDDGLKIDFRAPGPDTEACIAAIKALGLTYDVVLVDSYHEYAASYRDIEDALGLIAPNGTVVIHDCLPPLGDEDVVSPTFVHGAWCGVTFMAYADFVTCTAGIDYTTVETDFGCGIVQKSAKAHGPSAPAALLPSWARLGDDPRAALRFVHDNKGVLLRTASVANFVSDQKGKVEATSAQRATGRKT